MNSLVPHALLPFRTSCSFPCAFSIPISYPVSGKESHPGVFIVKEEGMREGEGRRSRKKEGVAGCSEMMREEGEEGERGGRRKVGEEMELNVE